MVEEEIGQIRDGRNRDLLVMAAELALRGRLSGRTPHAATSFLALPAVFEDYKSVSLEGKEFGLVRICSHACSPPNRPSFCISPCPDEGRFRVHLDAEDAPHKLRRG